MMINFLLRVSITQLFNDQQVVYIIIIQNKWVIYFRRISTTGMIFISKELKKIIRR